MRGFKAILLVSVALAATALVACGSKDKPAAANKQGNQNTTSTVPLEPLNMRTATFEWRLEWRDPSYQTTLETLASKGITDIFVEISDAAAPTPPPLLATQLDQFVQRAKALGISVQALAGDPTWAQDTASAINVVNFVSSYNLTHTPVTGLQIDVEPWGLDDWAGSKVQYAQDFLNCVKLLQTTAATLPMSFAIPVWFDKEANVPAVSFNGTIDTPYGHLLTLLTNTPDSILLMAYTNHADGAKGSIELARPLLDKADQSNVKVTVAQETGNSGEKGTTYFKAASAFADDLPKLRQALNPHDSFDGLAIHDAEGFLGLSN